MRRYRSHRRRITTFSLFAKTVLFVTILFAIGCTVEHDWYPAGKVTVVDHYQTDDFGTPLVSIVYRIDNPSTSSATIYATTATFVVKTDLYTYHCTAVDTSIVLAGHFVFGTYECMLRESDEMHDSVSLLDSFFE